MYNKSGGQVHLLFLQYVYTRDSSVYFDGHLLFSEHETIFPIITWKSQQ